MQDSKIGVETANNSEFHEIHPPTSDTPLKSPRNVNNPSADTDNNGKSFFSFAGSHAMDTISIEPDESIHGSPLGTFSRINKLFGSDSSGYSEPITGDDDVNSTPKKSKKHSKTHQNEVGGSDKQNLSKSHHRANGKVSSNNKNLSQTDQNHRSILSTSSSSSDLDSISTSQISVSTLNPSDFSENFSPSMSAVIGNRHQQPQNAPNNSSNQNSLRDSRNISSQRSPRNNSRYNQGNIPIVRIQPQSSRNLQSISQRSNRAPPSRRRQSNAENSPRSTAGSRRRPLYLPPIPEEIPEPSDSMKSLIKKAMNNEKLDDLQDSEYTELIVSLQQERRRRASDRNYKDGQKLNDAIKNVKAIQLKCQKQARVQLATEKYNERFQKLQADIQAFDEETQKLKEELIETQQEQKQQLLDRQQEQLDKLKEQWTSTNKVRMYNHASNNITTLQKRQKLLLMQARFAEAEELENIINQKMKEEQTANHENHQHGYDSSVKLLQEKHQGELDFFEETSKIQLQKFQQKRDRLRIGYNNQLKRCEAQAELLKDPDKLWNLEQFQRKDMCSMMASVQPSGQIKATDIIVTEKFILDLPELTFKDKTEKPKVKTKTKQENVDDNQESTEPNQI